MAINEVTSIDVKTLPPFKRLIMTIGELPTSYLESMTYAELLMWFCNFLQEKVLPTINNNADALQEVITYLENLDLQDEVNNKLDEMAESGQLQEIVADYLNSKAIFGFDTVADMKEATNLIDGSYAKTLGYHSLNDGGSSLYKIRNITNNDVVNDMNIIALNDNNLIAELIPTTSICPEMYGAYSDGIHDDTDVIDFIFNLDNPIICLTDKIYLCSDTIKLKKRKNINFNLSTLKFTNNDVGLEINMESESSYSHNRFAPIIENLVLDGENTSKVVYIDYAYKSNIRNIYINNFKNIGMEKNRGYELVIDNIWFWASNKNTSSIGLLVTGNDCEYGNIFGINCHTGVKMIGGGNHFKNIHMWLFNDTQNSGMSDGTALYTDSAMIEIAGNDRYFVDYCYFDSYQYAIKYNGYGELYLNSGLLYTADLTNLVPTFNQLPIYLIYADSSHLPYIYRIVINNFRYALSSGLDPSTINAKVVQDEYNSIPLRIYNYIIPYVINNIPQNYIDRFTIQNGTNIDLQATPISDTKLRLHGTVRKDSNDSTQIIIPYPNSAYYPDKINEAKPCVTSASQYGTSPSLAMINIGTNNIATMGNAIPDNYYFIDTIINIRYL